MNIAEIKSRKSELTTREISLFNAYQIAMLISEMNLDYLEKEEFAIPSNKVVDALELEEKTLHCIELPGKHIKVVLELPVYFRTGSDPMHGKKKLIEIHPVSFLIYKEKYIKPFELHQAQELGGEINWRRDPYAFDQQVLTDYVFAWRYLLINEIDPPKGMPEDKTKPGLQHFINHYREWSFTSVPVEEIKLFTLSLAEFGVTTEEHWKEYCMRDRVFPGAPELPAHYPMNLKVRYGKDYSEEQFFTTLKKEGVDS